MEILDVSKIPYEIWEKIAFHNVNVFNILGRTIPKLGRKTIYDTKFQNHIISSFKLYTFDVLGNICSIINGKPHSIYNKPAVIWTDGTREWWQNGKLIKKENQPI